MIVLKNRTDSLVLTTYDAVSTDWYVSWVDQKTPLPVYDDAQGNVATATDTTMVDIPISARRAVDYVSVRNLSASAHQTVRISKLVGTTKYALTPDLTLDPGEVLQFDGNRWTLLDSGGSPKIFSAHTGLAVEVRTGDPNSPATGQQWLDIT